jgi:hypothetical protein
MQDRLYDQMLREWYEDEQEQIQLEEHIPRWAFYPAEVKAYKAELKRRGKIGKTIDPAIAETMFWYADFFDPYCILPSSFHAGQSGREHFARNPGGEWVHFYDLPAKTADVLWERDGRKLVFPYGVFHDYDVVNKPVKA